MIVSLVNGVLFGMMFLVLVIFIFGYGDDFNCVVMVFGCIVGGVFGVVFVILLCK